MKRVKRNNILAHFLTKREVRIKWLGSKDSIFSNLITVAGYNEESANLPFYLHLVVAGEFPF